MSEETTRLGAKNVLDQSLPRLRHPANFIPLADMALIRGSLGSHSVILLGNQEISVLLGGGSATPAARFCWLPRSGGLW